VGQGCDRLLDNRSASHFRADLSLREQDGFCLGRRCLRKGDLVRCQRVCLEQIQFLLGHVSVQTTEKYLGCKQKLRVAVNDHIGIEPDD
jgi:hypothetical protein